MEDGEDMMILTRDKVLEKNEIGEEYDLTVPNKVIEEQKLVTYEGESSRQEIYHEIK